MSSVTDKAKTALTSYQSMLLEQPSPHSIKRFLIAVNGWCNSKCTFCNIWQYDKRKALTEEVTLEDLERNLFRSPALAQVLNIGITGGEPFLRRDIVQVCKSMYDHFRQVQLGFVTNGIRYEQIAETTAQIVASSPGRQLSIAVSLDGYGENHDLVRGVPGNFDRVLKTIELVKAQSPSVQLGFSHTVTPTSMYDSLRCYELSKELGIGFMYRLAHNSVYLNNEDTLIWSPETLQAVRPIVEELNRRMEADQGLLSRLGNTNYASIAFYNKTLDYFENPRRTFECYSGTHSFFLAHTGEVYPCINLGRSMGNIRQQALDDIWFAERADQIRKPIANWKCHCWTNCETEFSLARQKTIFFYGLEHNFRSLLSSRPVVPQEATDKV